MVKHTPRLMAALLLGGALLTAAGCATSAAAPTTTPALQPADEGARVIADARVVPVKSATLSLPLGGRVAEVLVAEGDEVTADQPLLRLDDARAKAAVAQAEAALQGAQAHLAGLRAGPRPEEVSVAEAAVARAQAALAKLQAGADEAQVAAASAEAASAEAALRQAQSAYDRVRSDPGVAARPESLALEQATNAYDAARARLEFLVKGPRPADLAVAEAEVGQAQAQLELTRAGARAEELGVAEADVAAAQAALEQARAALADTELRAPFACTVAWLDARPGEQVAAGAPLAQLGDLPAWQIETEDLAEVDVVNVREGALVTITFDALPDLELQGRVTRVCAYGESLQGDIVYRATIVPEVQDPRLRWNMTASVAIEP